MASTLPSTSDTGHPTRPSKNPALIQKLLEVRKYGRPPFLVRNLKYVVDDKKQAHGKVWDLAWTEPCYRSASGRRQLIFQVKPTRCILNVGTTEMLLQLPEALRKYDSTELYYPKSAKLRLWLSIKQEDGNYVAFGIRDSLVNVWPQEHIAGGMLIEDFSVTETFDLSAVMAVLGSFPAALSLVVEVYSELASAKPVNAYAHKLRGEICLLNRDITEGSAIPNGRVHVPLRFATSDSSAIPLYATTIGSPTAIPITNSVIRQDPTREQPDLDITMTDSASSLRRLRRDSTGENDGRGKEGSDGNLRGEDSDNDTNQSGDGEEELEREPDGSICLDLQGSVQNAISELTSTSRPRVYITCSYSSQELPFWDGIVRHDFICPWCHRNCHRFRTLLSHFQIEHDQMKFSLEGIPSSSMFDDANGVPFLLKFQVTPVESRSDDDNANQRSKKKKSSDHRSGRRTPTKDAVLEDSYANPNRYALYSGASSARKRSEDVQREMEKVSIQDGAARSDSASTEFEEDRDMEFLSAVREELWSSCKYCQRPHQKTYNSKADFCGEYCEIIYKKRLTEGEGPEVRDSKKGPEPLLSLASVSRQRRINYKEALGHRKLYHVVSVCRANETHFDEEDPDSEEEVDHSWRLELCMERVRHLENIHPKEKLLWMMWNRFAHENYPMPSVYAERYTRFTLELFALEYGERIANLQLRLHFTGFVRALYVHGLIDTVAITSIFLCLDGKKKRRQCGNSSRPELPKETNGRNGRGRGSARGRNGRKKN